MLNGTFQIYNTFAIYWPFLQFAALLTRHSHSNTDNYILFLLRPLFSLNTMDVLCRTSTSSYHMQKPIFQVQYTKHVLFSFFQDHFLVQSSGYPLQCKNYVWLYIKKYISTPRYELTLIMQSLCQ